MLTTAGENGLCDFWDFLDVLVLFMLDSETSSLMVCIKFLTDFEVLDSIGEKVL